MTSGIVYVIMASYKKKLDQMISSSSSNDMKPLPLSMRSKTASELRILAEIISRMSRPSLPDSNSSSHVFRERRGCRLWEAVTREFNAIPWVSKRTPLQLRKFWGNHKCRNPVSNTESENGHDKVNDTVNGNSNCSPTISFIKEESESNVNSNETDSESDYQSNYKLVPEVEIITEPGSVLEVSHNGQLTFSPNEDSVDVTPFPEHYDEKLASGSVLEDCAEFRDEEYQLRIALLRQQQLYRQVEHAAKIEEHEEAMKIYEMQKEYWKKKLTKL